MRAEGITLPEVEHRSSPVIVSRYGFPFKFLQGEKKKEKGVCEGSGG